MAEPPRVSISGVDRVGLFGRTGAGKTTLARYLLSRAYNDSGKRFVVLDAKHTYTQQGVKVYRHFQPKQDVQIVRDDGRAGYDFWDEQLYRIWKAGRRIVYVDEATLITPPRAILPELGACIRTGRERGLGTWVGSQRPKDLPSPIFTEAEHIFAFRLQWDADREKVASFTSDAMWPHMDAIKGAARKHDAVYYDVHNDRIVSLRMTRETG